FVGSEQDWQRATAALSDTLSGMGLRFTEDPGEGVFYGPKIDIKIKDSLGRTWQCTTVQVDFNLPERFDVEYVDREGKRVRPFMIHRALLGSLERFFGVLLEHHAGAFPLWLAPVQAVVLPITDAQHQWAGQVLEALRARGIRAELDDRNEKLGYRIREAQLQKIPYMVVIGKREQQQGAVAPRSRAGKDLGAMPLEQFCRLIADEAAPPSQT
ncbi:MAG: threonine--tRNA ligase, partial [Deltaproteobacteria bacterium]